MIVYLNGEFVPEQSALVSVFDRGFLYGDALFETVRIANSKPFRWREHLERLCQGANFLKIAMPLTPEALGQSLNELINRNTLTDALARVTLSRGVGVRGYSPQGATRPTLVMSLHTVDAGETMPGWHLRTSSQRLLTNALLAQFKTCNKLPQIVARAEADAAGAHEAILLNNEGYVVEGSRSNLFWIEHDTIWTPPIAAGILPGVTRAVILEICHKLNFKTGEASLFPEQLRRTAGVFFSLSSDGIAEGLSLDGHPLNRSPLVKTLHATYCELLRSECQ
jgi:branched-chain amino acid aminotransferase